MRPPATSRREVLWPRATGPVWAALLVNVMTFSAAGTALAIPGRVGQLITQGMLPLAALLALRINPRGIVRPNALLAVLTALAIEALVVAPHSEQVLSSTYRSLRLCAFVAVLWLLTPLWGRDGLPLLRAHLTALRWIVGSVVLGLALFPGVALDERGRLSGVLWPIPATQVGHYSAVLIGCTVILWLGRAVNGRTVSATLLVGLGVLIGCQTRTALAGLALGLVVGGSSLLAGHVRARRTAISVALLGLAVGLPLSSAIGAWLTRGESAENTATLTGRTKVWTMVLSEDRGPMETVFGSGLLDKGFQGLAIDSSWIATYVETGWFGVAAQVCMLLVLLTTAARRPQGVTRAVALFLISYCTVASFTETGLGDASPYLLDLFVAGALLAPRVSDRNVPGAAAAGSAPTAPRRAPSLAARPQI